MSRLPFRASPGPARAPPIVGPGLERDWRLLGDAAPSPQGQGQRDTACASHSSPFPPTPTLPVTSVTCVPRERLTAAGGAGGRVFPACTAPERRPVESLPGRPGPPTPGSAQGAWLSHQDVFIPLSLTPSSAVFRPDSPGVGDGLRPRPAPPRSATGPRKGVPISDSGSAQGRVRGRGHHIWVQARTLTPGESLVLGDAIAPLYRAAGGRCGHLGANPPCGSAGSALPGAGPVLRECGGAPQHAAGVQGHPKKRSSALGLRVTQRAAYDLNHL